MGATIHREAEAPVQGDARGASEKSAFAELYDRYFPEVYDFVVRAMGETERVREVVREAFIETLQEFRQQRSAAPVDALLFAAARRIALEHLHRSSGTNDPDTQAVLDTWLVSVDPQRVGSGEVVPDEDLAKMVWQLLSAHSSDEYSLIDLNLRRGLQPAALAPAIGLDVDDAAASLSSLQASVEDWITTALLIHRGIEECADLSSTLDQLGPNAPSADLRTAVGQHLNGCTRCGEFRTRYPTAATTFAALAAVPAAEGLKESIWLDIGRSLESKTVKATAVSGSTVFDLPVRLWNGASAKQKAIGGVAGAFAVAVFITVVIVLAPSSGIGVSDPSDVSSSTHEIGQPLAENVISVEWTPEPEAVAYSVEWSQAPDTLPDDVPELTGSASGTESPELDPGSWYFHLRTQGPGGQWTSTVNLGPYVIVSSDEVVPDPTATPEPDASPTPTATPEPTSEPTEAPQPTDNVVVVPAPVPTSGPAPVPQPTIFVPDPTPFVPPPSPCPATITLPEPANPTGSMGPAETVRQYYLLLNQNRYAEAFALLTVDLQTGLFSPYSAWVEGFSTTTIVNPLSVSLLAQGDDFAVVAVEVVAVDVDVFAGETQWHFFGSWSLENSSGTWLMSAPAVEATLC